jgi:Zn-dependent protease with chaperone function
MERTEFEALVGRMEALERANPGAYRRRVLAWAAMGYGYLLIVVIALLGLCALLVLALSSLKAIAVKLLFIVVPLLFITARSLWVKFEPPAGERVTRRDAPELFALLDSLQSRLKTPRVHEVVMTEELNAAVTQVPRLGFLGWHRNFLLLGLPLMKGLTVEQFTAVLAHELGHLSRGHARVSNWIYRLRRIWSRLDDEFSQGGQVGAGIILKFFHWYSPRFSATSFPLARSNEFEADAASVRLTSAQAAAQALTGINVLASYLDQKYWPSIHDRAKELAQPAFAPYSSFVGNAVMEVPDEERSRWQAEALARTTSYADTHPALSDRLAAIGAAAEFLPPAQGMGAETLLGAMKAQLEQKFDRDWQERIATSWREFHEETQQARKRLVELRDAGDRPDLSEDTLLEWARVEERVGEGAERALALRRDARSRFPDSAVAQFVLGRQLVLQKDEEGVAMLTAAMERDAGLESHGTELLRDYYWTRGDKEQARQWHDRYMVAAGKMQEARAERDTLLATDTYVPHGLGEAELAKLVEQLRNVPGIRRAYLVRKLTRQFPDQPFFALGYACSGPFELSDAQKISAALEAIKAQVEFPGETMIVSVEKGNKAFGKLFRKVPGSRVT